MREAGKSSVCKMASRGDEQFIYILTSDGCMDVYPDNKSSDFRIMLKDPIDLEDDWEVGLLDINYPYTWTNVGPAARVYMKYFLDHKVHEINFPDWQCHSMKEVIKFIEKRLTSEGEGATKQAAKVHVGLDELGRFKMGSTAPEFDYGFSPNMMKLLGIAGHDEADRFTMEAFESRQATRDRLYTVYKDENPFDANEEIIKQLKATEDLVTLTRIMKPYIDHTKLNVFEGNEDVIPASVPEKIKEDAIAATILGLFNEWGASWTFLRNYSYFLFHLKDFYEYSENFPPKKLKGVTPGILNPVLRMYIYTNIIEAVDMNDGAKKLLKLVNTRGESYKTTHEVYTHPTYHPIQRGGKIAMIHIYISDETGERVPFQHGTVVLTLHFRRQEKKRW